MKDMAQRRIALAFTEHERGAPFQWIPGDNPDLACSPDEAVDVVLIDNIHCWDPLKIGVNLRAIKRMLRAGGLLRVSTPNLDAAVHAYLLDWEGSRLESRAAYFNEWWRTTKAQFLFNEEELRRVLREAGFVDLRSFVPGASSDPLFWDAGDIDNMLLVLEARKPRMPV
jgi:predicted SAM-dependent methyltransferase